MLTASILMPLLGAVAMLTLRRTSEPTQRGVATGIAAAPALRVAQQRKSWALGRAALVHVCAARHAEAVRNGAAADLLASPGFETAVGLYLAGRLPRLRTRLRRGAASQRQPSEEGVERFRAGGVEPSRLSAPRDRLLPDLVNRRQQ